jgi:hypothetical protein
MSTIFFDDSLIERMVETTCPTTAPPFTVQFNICSGATVTASDFNCLVEQAGAAVGAQTAYGVTCSVTVM